jgi:hypothetical protein
MHVGGAQLDQEERAQYLDVSKVKKYGGSPSGGGDKMLMLNSLMWLQLYIFLDSLTRNFRRSSSYPPFAPPPLHIFNHEENTVDSEEVSVEEREDEERSDETCKEEGEFNNTLPQVIVVWKDP